MWCGMIWCGIYKNVDFLFRKLRCGESWGKGLHSLLSCWPNKGHLWTRHGAGAVQDIFRENSCLLSRRVLEIHHDQTWWGGWGGWGGWQARTGMVGWEIETREWPALHQHLNDCWMALNGKVWIFEGKSGQEGERLISTTWCRAGGSRSRWWSVIITWTEIINWSDGSPSPPGVVRTLQSS